MRRTLNLNKYIQKARAVLTDLRLKFSTKCSRNDNTEWKNYQPENYIAYIKFLIRKQLFRKKKLMPAILIHANISPIEASIL